VNRRLRRRVWDMITTCWNKDPAKQWEVPAIRLLFSTLGPWEVLDVEAGRQLSAIVISILTPNKQERNADLWSPIKINWSVFGPSAVKTWLSKISPASSTRTTVGEAARIRSPCLAAPVVVQAMILFSFKIASVFLPYIRSIDAKQLLYASPVSYTWPTCSLKRASCHVFTFSLRSAHDINQILNAFTTFSW